MSADVLSCISSWVLEHKFTAFLAAACGYLIVKHHNFIWAVLRTLRRDLTGTVRVGKALVQLISVKSKNKTVGDAFNETVAKYPDKICFYFQDEKWSFSEVHELTNKVGNYFSSQGFQKGDVIGIFMENCPEYIPMWLGLSKIGVVPALVNTNLREEPLKHSFDIVNCKAVIYAEDLSHAIEDLLSASYLSVPVFSYSRTKTGEARIPSATNLSQALSGVSTEEPVPKAKVNFLDNLYYIYTSGTTGLPKAATIKHARFFMGGLGVHNFHKFKTEDIFYTSLPLYHSAGGMLGTGQVIIFGSTMALRKKFSASNFWTDCIAYNVTVIQYIGEICRYLLAQPETPQDRGHKVRLMFGNGLRREIWEKFVRRFDIPEVGEFYASTEGNANITNIDSTVGSVGFVPRLLYPLVHFKIIKVNEQTGEIIRDPKTGLAIICKPNESGEFVGTIIRNHIYKDFQGYVGSASSEQKIGCNIFKPGDTVFRSGDLMIMDELGYFYFKDRCGDTFRWKGENVSTNEVEAIISSTTQLKDCVVYGVQIIGTEGKAGMAAIVDDNANLDLEILARSLERKLPAYARPLFLRITAQIDATGTYKLKKIDLQKEGFDIQQVTDPVYFFQNGKYVPLDSHLYEQILAGEVRL